MNLRQLHCFIAVSDLQSVSRAATRLCMAQPAVTRTIKALEQDLGVDLFERSGRGIRATQAGKVFHDRVSGILRDLDRAAVEARAMARSPGGRVEVAMPVSVSEFLSQRFVESLMEQLPDVSVRILDGWTGFIIEWLILGRLDLGIIYDHTLKSDALHVEPLAAEEHFLICSPQHPLAGNKSVSLEELGSVLLVLPGREHGLRLSVESHLNSAGLAVHVVHEVESVVAIKRIVCESTFCSVLPLGNVEQEVALGRLVMIPIDGAPLRRVLFVTWSNERDLTEQAKAVLDIIRHEVGGLVAGRVWGERFFDT